MLRKAALQDIAKYGDFAYRLAMDQTKSGYPVYTDGRNRTGTRRIACLERKALSTIDFESAKADKGNKNGN